MLLLAIAALGAAAGDPPATAQPQPNITEEKRICKKQEVIGSRVKVKRVCLTQTQRNAIQQQSQQALQELTRLQKGPSGN